MIRLGELAAGTIFKYKETYALKSEYRNDNGICECFIVGSGEMFWGGVSNPNDLLVESIDIIKTLKENQWLYGKLNQISDVISSGREECKQF